MADYRPDPKILTLGPDFYDAVRPAGFPKCTPRFLNRRWADRIGRRNAILLAMTELGIFTLVIPYATTLWELGVLRFLAALGIGAPLFSPRIAVMGEIVTEQATSRDEEGVR